MRVPLVVDPASVAGLTPTFVADLDATHPHGGGTVVSPADDGPDPDVRRQSDAAPGPVAVA